MRAEPTSGDEAKIVAWLEANVGGKVLELARQPRWRPVWWVALERDGERLALCVRGDRTDMSLIFPLDHEMRLQRTLHEHGIPVPRVWGWIDDPRAYVMERVPGQSDFAEASAAERASVVDDYLRILARIHALPLAPFVAAGIARAETPEASGTLGMARYEKNWRAMKSTPDPFVEFALGWLRRNPPRSRGRESPIVWDSGQFHHANGKVVAVLDVEIGHLGDPMMDLAAWRQRDTVIGYGDMEALYARYADLSGRPVDREALQRHHFFFCLTNALSVGPATRRPPAASDLMTNLQWCCETNLFATEALAEILGVELPSVEAPPARESRAAVALDHLVRNLGALRLDDEYASYQVRTLFRTARHVARLDEIGDALARADLDDLHALLGRRPASWSEGEAELERFVLANADSNRHDAALLALFHRRHLRAQMTLGPAGSAMTRHARIQRFRS